MIMTGERNSLKMNSNVLMFVLVSLQLCYNVNGENNTNPLVPGIPILSLRSLSVDSPKDGMCDAGKLFGCKNCTTRLICDTKGTVLASRECSGSTPYCNGGICVEELPTSCPAPVSPLCPLPNQVYPSPVSCQRYIKCSANRTATEYVCPGLLVYDPIYYLCKRPNWSRDCPVINCTESSGKFIVYPLQPDIYFYCGATGDQRLLQCATKNEEFNVSELRCEPKCVRNGLMAATNKREYYVCAYNNDGGYDKYLMSCPDNTKYVASSETCI